MQRRILAGSITLTSCFAPVAQFMTERDFIPIWAWLIGAAYGLYLMLTPKWCLDIERKVQEKMRSQIANWSRGRTLPWNHRKVSLRSSKSRGPISVDHEQSHVSYHGPNGVEVALFIAIVNGASHEVAIEKLEMSIKTRTGLLPCPFVAFQPLDSLEAIDKAKSVTVSPGKSIEGWAHFWMKEGVRVPDFKRFIFASKVIGQPEQRNDFEPHDWENARQGQSEIVML